MMGRSVTYLQETVYQGCEESPQEVPGFQVQSANLLARNDCKPGTVSQTMGFLERINQNGCLGWNIPFLCCI